MSEKDKHKLSKILYYSDIHPADTEFINNIIYDLNKKYENAVSDYEQEHYKVIKARQYIETTDKWLCRVNDNLCVEAIGKDKLLEILGDKE